MKQLATSTSTTTLLLLTVAVLLSSTTTRVQAYFDDCSDVIIIPGNADNLANPGCQICNNGGYDHYPCNQPDLCYCNGDEIPEEYVLPFTYCSNVVAVPGNSHAVTDAQCATCNDGGTRYYPCNQPDVLCQCADESSSSSSSESTSGSESQSDSESESTSDSESASASQSTPAPATPVPETPVPETPVPETPVPETPVPETPVPETPVPETPVPETPVPETPVPETPVPETPVPETPVPETPVPETPVPETPVPETPVPETTVPETPITEGGINQANQQDAVTQQNTLPAIEETSVSQTTTTTTTSAVVSGDNAATETVAEIAEAQGNNLNNSQKSNSGISVFTIIGLVIAVVIFIILVAVGVFLCHRARKAAKEGNTNDRVKNAVVAFEPKDIEDAPASPHHTAVAIPSSASDDVDTSVNSEEGLTTTTATQQAKDKFVTSQEMNPLSPGSRSHTAVDVSSNYDGDEDLEEEESGPHSPLVPAGSPRISQKGDRQSTPSNPMKRAK